MTMPTTTKFCLPSDVHPHINTASGYAGDDAQIETHIKAATALIREHTRRSWETGTYTQFFSTQDIEIGIGRGSGVSRWYVDERPLQSVTSIKFNTAGRFADTDPLDSTDYYVEADKGRVVMYPGVMRSFARSLQIVYVAGYEINIDDPDLLDVDEALAQACAIQAGFTWQRALNQTSGKSQKQDKGGFANYSITKSGLVAEALALVKGKARTLVGTNG